MQAKVHWVEGTKHGRIGIIPRPRGGDWLEDEVSALRAERIDMVVSLLAPDEISELCLENLEAICLAKGIQFVSFPIPDRGVPRSREAAKGLLVKLANAIQSGKSVAIHCRQGIGRSALVVASLLVWSGKGTDEALRAVEKARGCSVPETTEQRIWIEELAAERRICGPVP